MIVGISYRILKNDSEGHYAIPEKYQTKKWTDSKDSKELGKVYSKGSSRYEIVSVKTKKFSSIEKISRISLGIILATVFLGLPMIFSKNMRELFKGSITRNFAISTIKPETSILEGLSNLKKSLSSIKFEKGNFGKVKKIQIVMRFGLDGNTKISKPNPPETFEPITLILDGEGEDLTDAKIKEAIEKCATRFVRGLSLVAREETFKRMDFISEIWVDHDLSETKGLQKNVIYPNKKERPLFPNVYLTKSLTPEFISKSFENYGITPAFVEHLK